MKSIIDEESWISLLKQYFITCNCLNMKNIQNNIINKEETKRIVKIEFLDELEEFNLIQEHYCISFGSNNDF